MTKQVQTTVLRSIVYLLLGFSLSSCSFLKDRLAITDPAITWHVPLVVEVPDELKQRVLMFWTYNYHREWLKCYELEAPEVHEGISKELYHAYYNGGWKNLGVDVVNVEFGSADKNSAKVFVSITYKQPGTTDKTKVVNLASDWKIVDSKWYHVFRDPIVKLRKGRGKQ
jgi:hypothetical protein